MFLFLTADISALGRMHAEMLTDHQRMELFFTPTDYDAARAMLGGDEGDACSWCEVYCDDSKNVDAIHWHSESVELEGTVSFAMLPLEIVYVYLFNQNISGEIDIKTLPKFLDFFCVEKCRISGTLDLGSLPPALQEFYVERNEITALRNFKNLPEELRRFCIDEPNIIEKSIMIGALPRSDLHVRLDGCRFTDVKFEDEADRARVTL